jgi:DNA topoisomerase-1
MTSTLQQSSYNTLKFSVSKTMSVAQRLYEGIPLKDPSTPVALITYMRTDSLRISPIATKQVRSYIEKSLGKTYLPASAKAYSKGKSKSQDAHEAIRPIDVTLTPDKVKAYLPADAAKLYDLIWRRFVASQVKPAEYAQKQVTVVGGPFTFKVTGSTLLFDGYLKVYAAEEEKEEKITIPSKLAVKETLSLDEVSPKQHFTQPPPRFTEATLVKELEKEGIGRPSTYATILKTIQERSYTEKDDNKRFVPTELGTVVTRMLTTNLPKIMDLGFTANMEENLDKVAGGTLKRDTLIKDFYKDFEKDLTNFKEEAKKAIEETNITCPECSQSKLIIRFGKAGPFAGCERYPECKFTSNFERLPDGSIKLVKAAGPQVLEEKCPKCGKPLRQMMGRFGPFIACTGYPECRYIKQTIANFTCPLCEKGDVVQKFWRGKTFWGCSTYPDCKFSISGDIAQTPCPQCSIPYLLKRTSKTGEITLKCSSKECGYSLAVEESQS